MKYLIPLISLIIVLNAQSAGVQWNNYPTVTTMGDSDTFLIGNGSTNQQLTAINFGVSRTVPLINTSSNLLWGNALSQINTSSNLLHTTAINDATNVVLGAGPVTLGGANITVSRAQNSNGGTNNTVALADPASLGQVNVGTAWLTNTVLPTNAMSGTLVDFNIAYASTNISGDFAFTGVANVTAGSHNSCIRRFYASGADKIITFPASFHTNYGFNPVVTNGWQMDLMFTVTGARTNVTQIIYP